MAKVIGLSHIVLTVDHDRVIPDDSTFAGVLYTAGRQFEFDHSYSRKPLLRADKNLLSRLTFFTPKNGDMPAMELLHAASGSGREMNSYGLIINEPGFTVPVNLKSIDLGITDFFAKGYFDPFLQSFICMKSDLPVKTKFGCWIRAADFDQQRAFLSSVATVKKIADDDQIFAVEVKVVNRTFSDFTIVLIRDVNEQQNCYNDDLGLSTLGWIAKDIQDETVATLDNESASFEIDIDKNLFNAKFLYNNKSISHELLQKK